MAKIRGIIGEIEGKHCVLITKQGEFIQMRTPKGAQVGQEVNINRTVQPWHKIALAAAVLLLFMLFPFYPVLTASAQPIAYLSLDINPSIELGINKNGKIVEAKAFNPEGESLLKETSLTDSNIYTAVQALIDKAIEKGFVHESGNLIVAAYTVSSKYRFDTEKLKSSVSEEIVKADVDAEVVVTPITMNVHKQARVNKVSQGKYLVFEAAKASGKEVNLEDLKQNGINRALEAKGVKVEDITPGVTKFEHKQRGKDKKEDKERPDKAKGKPDKEQGNQGRGR